MINRNIKQVCENFMDIENYEKAVISDEKYVIHHRLETHTSDGVRRPVDISKQELIALGMYWDRPSDELIFLTRNDHAMLHFGGKPSGNTGKKFSEESRKKLSNALKGNKNTLGHKLSEEHKRKISENSKTSFVSQLYKEYKANGGTIKWNEFQKKHTANYKKD